MRILESIGLLTAMAALMLVIAWLLAGPLGVIAATVMLIMTLPRAWRMASPLNGPGTRRIDPREAPDLYQRVRTLSQRAGLSAVPTLYHLATPIPNALTAGNGGGASIAISDGLLRQLPEREVNAVLAHEIAHIRHGDTRWLTLGAVFGQITRSFSFVGQLLVLINLPLMLMGAPVIPWIPLILLLSAPLISRGLLAAMSRGREFEADRVAADITGDPQALASALQRIERIARGFMGPFGALLRGPNWLQTHPATHARADALAAMPSDPTRWLPVHEPPTPDRQATRLDPSLIFRMLAGIFHTPPANPGPKPRS